MFYLFITALCVAIFLCFIPLEKNPNVQMWTFIQWKGIRFWSSGLHLPVKSHQGHGLIIPGDLKLVPSTPCKLFREQPGTSARTSLPVASHVLGHAASWRYCSWHTEEYIDRFCCKSSGHLKSKLCPSEYYNSDKCPLSCINQYLLRSLFWWNGHSLVWTGSHSGSSSHRRSKLPDRKDSSGLLEMNSVMQYPQ